MSARMKPHDRQRRSTRKCSAQFAAPQQMHGAVFSKGAGAGTALIRELLSGRPPGGEGAGEADPFLDQIQGPIPDLLVHAPNVFADDAETEEVQSAEETD